MKNNFKTIIQMVKELNYILNKGQKMRVFFVLFVILISSTLELLGVTAILPFVQALLTPEKLMGNPWISKFMDIFGISSDKGLLLLLGVGLILIYIFKNLYIIFSYYVQYDFSTRVQKDLSVKMLTSYLRRPYDFFLDTNSAEILRGCGSDTSGVYTIISCLTTIITELLTIMMIGLFIIVTDPWTAIGILLLMLVVMLGMIGIFKPVMKRAGKKNIEAATRKNKAIYQTISGIKEIFVMQRKELFLEEYKEASEVSRKVQRTSDFLGSCPDRIVEGICVSGLIGIVCIRLTMNANMIDFVPKLAAFAMAAFKILPSIGKITSRVNALVYQRLALMKVYDNMKEADAYVEQQTDYIKNSSVYHTEKRNIDFCEKLEISHVFWKYSNQKEPVLTDTTLSIEKGQSIAFIGASGAGKTTLADIILGLLHPQKGTVVMDGMDVYAMPEEWAKIVGYVPQAVFLMDDTVRNNISFGLPEELIEDEKIWDALERAQLKSFIETLPKGLDTIVGERGVKFSGGQRQRVAIARALYNRPEILVLDEATAALDNETETAVMESIDALQGQITMIIVAHRLTTIRNCDKIYEIRDGKAVERTKKEVLG